MSARYARLVPMLGMSGMVLSGCYTVLKAPYSSDFDEGSSRYVREDQRQDDYLSPRVGRFDDRDSGFVDPYGGYGAGAYGQGGGFPIFGYDSRYGGFGGYGSGYSPYSSRSGPYGYDPYYQGDGGVYIPPGYELVTSDELNRLRAADNALPSFTPTVNTGVDPVPASSIVDQKRDVWKRRSEKRVRRAPTVPPRSTVSNDSPSGSSSGSSAGKATSKPKSSTKPKKRRR